MRKKRRARRPTIYGRASMFKSRLGDLCFKTRGGPEAVLEVIHPDTGKAVGRIRLDIIALEVLDETYRHGLESVVRNVLAWEARA